MYQHILIATDGSDLARKAVDQGLALAKAISARVTAVTVTEPWTSVAPVEMSIAFPPEEYEKAAAANAAKILSSVDETAKRLGVTCQTLHLKDQYPSDGIVDTCKQRGCDLIVMASHGRRGLSRLVLGSQANAVVTHSFVPVLICR